MIVGHVHEVVLQRGVIVVHETARVGVADNEVPYVGYGKAILVTLEEFANFWRLAEGTGDLRSCDASYCGTHLGNVNDAGSNDRRRHELNKSRRAGRLEESRKRRGRYGREW